MIGPLPLRLSEPFCMKPKKVLTPPSGNPLGAPLRHGARRNLALPSDNPSSPEAVDKLAVSDDVFPHDHECSTLNGECVSPLHDGRDSLMGMGLWSRLERVLTACELSQAALARAAGVSPSNINQIKSGRVQALGAEPAFKLQKKTGFAAEWLMFGVGPEKLVGISDPDQRELLEWYSQLGPVDRGRAKKYIIALADARRMELAAHETKKRLSQKKKAS